MRTQIASDLTPKAIEPILVWLVHKPVAGAVRNAISGDGGTNRRVAKTGRHDRGADVEWLAHILANAIREAGQVTSGIGSRRYEHARSIGQRCLETCQ